MSRQDDHRGSLPVPGTGWNAFEPDDTEQVAHAFGTPEGERYREDLPLGEGGMGSVHAAWDARLRRIVAVKVAAPGSAAEARLAQEAWIAAQLDHPGIVPVHDAGIREDGHRYVVMRRIRGRTLHEVLQDGMPPRLDLLPVLRSVVDAVAHAHDAGIVHRDLTPSNVLIDEHGIVQVVDWGLARPTDEASEGWGREVLPPEDAARTRRGVVLGTPGYMSPEQAVGAPVDPRADVWALGALLHELLTGVFPYGDLEDEERQRAIAYDDVPDVREQVPAVPPALADLAGRALSRRPGDRPTDGGAFLAELDAALPRDEPARQRVGLGIGLALLGIAGLAVGGWALTPSTPPDLQPDLLISEALRATERGAWPEAEVLAAHALSLRDTPDIRGMLAGLRAGPRPELLRTTSRPDACPLVALAPRGEAFVCSDGSHVALYDGAGVEQWRRTLGTRVSGLFVADEAVVVSQISRRIAVLSRTDGQSVGRPLSVDLMQHGGDAGTALHAVGERGVVRIDTMPIDGAPEALPLPVPFSFEHKVVDLADGSLVLGTHNALWHRLDGTWTELGTLPFDGERDALRWMRVGPDGGNVLLATWEGRVGSWRPGTPADAVVFHRVPGAVLDVDASADGQRYVVADDRGGARVLDAASGVVLMRMPSAHPEAVRFLDDRRIRLVGDRIATWRLPDPTWPAAQRAGVGVGDLDARSEGLAFASAELAEVRDRRGRTRWSRLVPRAMVKSVRLDAAQERVALAGIGLQGVEVVDLRDGARRALPDTGQAARRQAVWLDDDLVASIDYRSGAPYVSRVADGEPLPSFTLPPLTMHGLARVPGHPVAWGLASDGRLVRIAAEEQASEVVAQGPTDVRGLAAGADGSLWAVVDDGLAQLDPATAQATRRLPVARDLTALHVLPDGDLATGHLDGRVRVWSPEGALRWVARGHDERVAALDDHDGVLFSGGWDGVIRTWRLDVADAAQADLLGDATTTWDLDLPAARAWAP